MRTHASLFIFTNKDDVIEYHLTSLVYKMYPLFEKRNVFTTENVQF